MIIASNHVSDCAFSAIRANSASNVQISGNTCLRSGETAIYSEFSFEEPSSPAIWWMAAPWVSP
ncbi:hypothetical protein V6L77_18445 [Pannonibacter sp. Pt2-lr]